MRTNDFFVVVFVFTQPKFVLFFLSSHEDANKNGYDVLMPRSGSICSVNKDNLFLEA